jgi:hypothetical protein
LHGPLGENLPFRIKVEEAGNYGAVDELQEEKAESILSVEPPAHSLRVTVSGTIVTSGGPAALALV